MSTTVKTTLACALALGISVPAGAMAAGQDRDTTYQGQTAQERAHRQAKQDKDRHERDMRHRSAHDRMEAEENDGSFMDGNRPDAWVLTKVKTKFATSGTVDASDINVDVENGVTYLRGTVGSSAERREAVRLAEETEGVTRVDASGLRMVSGSEDNR